MARKQKKVTISFFVDKAKQRVALAEADSDFIDILFSFLTLPLGTIVRLLNKQSNIGCMDKLYGSVENLDVHNFQTEACKTMLLFPQSAAAVRCEDLKVNIDSRESNPRTIYVCRKAGCCAKATCLGSSVLNARCPHCRETMDSRRTRAKGNVDAGKLFVKSGDKFMITDDLRITPFSMEHYLSFIRKLGKEDECTLEEKVMDLGRDEILTLLRRLLVSSSPLTDLFFKNVGVTNDASQGIDIKNMIRVKRESNTEAESKETHINLFLNKSTKKVSFVEVEEDYVNFIFSFLTLPLGALIKLQNNKSFLGCVDNLYRSATKVSSDKFKSEECRDILLSPKLASFFGYTGNMLKVDEIAPPKGFCRGCYSCFWNNNDIDCEASECVHGVKRADFRMLNPKSPEGRTETGGGYAKGKFLVTTDLCVSQLSASSSLQTVKSQDLSFSDLEMKRAVFGEMQALDLLRSAVTSKTPIDDVLNIFRKAKVEYEFGC
ncbi:uncharacterized protein LOC109826145 [Asparagus officinalis]|uniref:uncharacterized protein LOC109826145 n=1 Tax=Asparagus officinalis TaxID=4686 RepID=UPI00098DE2B5|nr:uncharacterized protein LOC109826145 [Asparagus officinalis]